VIKIYRRKKWDFLKCHRNPGATAGIPYGKNGEKRIQFNVLINKDYPPAARVTVEKKKVYI
jgi:hypothetical protein